MTHYMNLKSTLNHVFKPTHMQTQIGFNLEKGSKILGNSSVCLIYCIIRWKFASVLI